ncbi:MAG: hypothetical protein NTW86_07725 [Candidatus Sumerlaeota bacterium]|nr:hypothetical protein [Candidatus Sumerlaeota bacterium]
MTGPPQTRPSISWLTRLAPWLALAWGAALVLCFFLGQLAFVETNGGRRLIGLWGVFGALRNGFSYGGAPFPILPLLGGLAALWVFARIGRLFLQCFEIYLPRTARSALALLCGMGIVGILLEPLAIFGWLNTTAVWMVLLLTIAVLWRVAYKAQSRPPRAALANQDARVLRRALSDEAQRRYEATWMRPRGFGGRAFALAAKFLIVLVTALTFYHALLYPETYWDSLILYLGYARMTFLQHKFPVKVVAQVGIGLGANYPHWYPLLGATVAAMWHHWSALYQQLMAPVAGLATTVLVYHTVLRLTRRVNLALAAALLFRAIPYAIAYDIWASDYAIAMFLAAAFCYLALLYIETGMRGFLIALTLLTAAGTHLNYLMWMFWGLWVLAVILAHAAQGVAESRDIISQRMAAAEAGIRLEAEFASVEPREPLRALARTRWLRTLFAVGIALSLPWHIRNWIVTGNPVYAFFPGIFDGKRINPEVLRSAFGEWRANGDGIGVIAQQLYWADTLLLRLRASWYYFVEWQSRWPQFWKIAPVFMAFAMPGLFAFIVGLVRRYAGRFRNLEPARAERVLDDPTRFGLIVAALLLGHLAYFYVLADFYLYQIIAIAPVLALCVAWWPLGLAGKIARGLFGLLVLAVGVMPGVAVALMGPKAPTDDLAAFREPLQPESQFYKRVLPGAEDMFEHINANLKGERLLTHENRDLLMDPSITLVQLDDWEVQPLYDIPSAAERAARLKQMGIHYYLRTPMEAKHVVNRRLGLDELIAQGFLRKVYATGDARSGAYTLYILEQGAPGKGR